MVFNTKIIDQPDKNGDAVLSVVSRELAEGEMVNPSAVQILSALKADGQHTGTDQ